MRAVADEAVARCRRLALCTEEPGAITRTFLSPPMHDVHGLVRGWMEEAGLEVRVDAAGNIRGRKGAALAPTLFIGSHLDTVPHAGAFDGILGVVLGIALARHTPRRRAIEVIGFSEEEGVRFGVPFIGSRALVGDTDGLRPMIDDSLRAFGLEPALLADAEVAPGDHHYFEVHIEQGRVLEQLERPLAVVDTVAGQSQLEVTFNGQAEHAATPMSLRRDALTAAAEWIVQVEHVARATDGLVATVGRISAQPGARNVVPGTVTMTLDVRHRDDRVRREAVTECRRLSAARGLDVTWTETRDQPAVPLVTEALTQALEASGIPFHQMTSGAGHDAMIVARRMPASMLFIRTPGGLSHHPDESVLVDDVAAALEAARRFVEVMC